jgi:hypothetical protein
MQSDAYGPFAPKADLQPTVFRQKPIGDYIVDFNAPAVRLVAEINDVVMKSPA